MKKYILLIIGIFCLGLVQAQTDNMNTRKAKKAHHQKMSSLTPDQAAELSTKKLTLALDLSEAQQSKIKALELEKALKRQELRKVKESKKEITDEEKYKMKAEMLDHKIDNKAKMKAILTAQQYEKWEKMSYKRRGKAHRSKKGAHPQKKQG